MQEDQSVAKHQRQGREEEQQLLALHVRYLQDRALPASTVLSEVQRSSGGSAPAPLFVP